MRPLLFFLAPTLGSIAFQASVALYPQTLQHYAWLVRWVWIAWAIIWLVWLVTHPRFVGSLLGYSGKAASVTAPTPSPSAEAHASILPEVGTRSGAIKVRRTH